MQCPKCGSSDVYPLSSSETTEDVKGYGCCKGGLGYLIAGPVGLLCGLCGMGKGKSVTSIHTYWVCKNCNNRWH